MQSNACSLKGNFLSAGAFSVFFVVIASPYLQFDYSIRPVSFHWIKQEIPLEVLSIEAGDGKAITEASLSKKQTNSVSIAFL